jgi:nucleoside-diphosphate-sugar epimerase
VEDVAEGLLRLGLSEAMPGEVVNLATGKLTSVRAFAETAADVLQISAQRLHFGALPTRSAEMAHAPVAIGRLRELVDWTPPTEIKQGIRRTVEFSTLKPYVVHVPAQSGPPPERP